MHLLKAFLFLLGFSSQFCMAQMSGVILNEQGEVLPYATLFIENTNTGTTTNLDGEYRIDIPQTRVSIRVQYVGYITQRLDIPASDKPIYRKIVLQKETISIPELVISADAEDPAYDIIRNAQKMRAFYGNSTKSYEADLYVKGLVKMLDAPEAFLGEDLGNMNGILDSTRQGIVYLSESKSKVYYEAPNNYREQMYASKVAGDDNGISFNQFFGAKFSFYEEYIRFGRNLISPLADASFNHYRFRLLGTFYDDQSRLINKIELTPKSNESPAFFGVVYIAEDDWYIHSVDLGFTGKAAREHVFDTIRVKQLYNTKALDNHQVLQHQIIDFKMGVFSFKLGGTFSYFLSEYELDPEWEEYPFSSEIFSMSRDANTIKNQYWDTIRPIPLTIEEGKDYVKKDSLAQIWESQEYLDSTDRVSNRFSMFDLILGYQYNQSFKHRYFNFESILSGYQFNPIEGHVISLNASARFYNHNENAYWSINPLIRYGFADDQWKPSITIKHKYNSRNKGYWTVSGGRQYNQIDDYAPVGSFGNTLGGLFVKNNNLKLYDLKFIKASWSQELWNGFEAKVTGQYFNRAALSNNSDYSFFSSDKPYEENAIEVSDPNNTITDTPHQGYLLKTRFTWKPGQKYMTIGDYKSRIPSKWPNVILDYKGAFSFNDNDLSFDYLELTLLDRRVDLNLMGYFSYRATIGGFIRKRRVGQADAKHYHGNLIALVGTKDYLYQYKVLPYYDYSHQDRFTELFIEHHLDGYLVDRIPLLKRLGVKSVFGFSGFYQDADKNYIEASLGLEDIGVGMFKFLRLDYAIGFYDGAQINSGLVLMLTLDL